jgi:hypothetical protein
MGRKSIILLCQKCLSDKKELDLNNNTFQDKNYLNKSNNPEKVFLNSQNKAYNKYKNRKKNHIKKINLKKSKKKIEDNHHHSKSKQRRNENIDTVVVHTINGEADQSKRENIKNIEDNIEKLIYIFND